MNNSDIIAYFFCNDNINKNKIKEYNNGKTPSNIKEYLDNIYNDSDSLSEKLWRIKNNLDKRPICKYCGGKVKHISKNKYRTYCSNTCRNKDLFEVNRQITIQKYGTSFNREKTKQTKKELYGDEYYNNSKRIKETLLNKTQDEKNIILEKRINTVLNKYKVINVSQLTEIKEKKKNTCLKHYGVNSYLKTDDCKEKSKQSFLKNKDKIIQKIQDTNLKRYGVKGYNYVVGKKTKLERYNDENYNNRKKYIDTLQKKYGVNNVLQIPEVKEKVSKILSLPETQDKINKSKHKNNSFHTSKIDEQSYQLLKEKFPDVKYQYRSKEYPFNCDFYIPSLNLYIECQYGWQHCHHPYNKDDKEDQKLLEIMKTKNTKYYNNVINTWTIRDVKKRNIAKQNNLNYIEFWNIKELINWLNNN